MRIQAISAFKGQGLAQQRAVVARRARADMSGATPVASGHVRVSLSPEAQNALAEKTAPEVAVDPAAEVDPAAAARKPAPTAGSAAAGTKKLNEEEQAMVVKLKSREAEVRAHEQAHLSASGGFARGGAAFSYQKGPDGQRYAVGGHVSIDASPVKGDPSATLAKAAVVRAAALAPADPSGQDQSVAASATRMATNARAQLAEQARAENAGNPESKPEDSGTRATAAAGTTDETRPTTERPRPGAGGFAPVFRALGRYRAAAN